MTEDFWEQRYAATERSWSGRVNATMATTVEGLTPGRALDLGCGEGGDVLWLAAQGWEAHGIDISPTAVERGREQAQATGASATFESRDLAGWDPDGTYDLVTASFFHSPVTFPRDEVLRRAAGAVAPGGHLLLVTHAAPPPWADPQQAHHLCVPARHEADALGLDPGQWDEVQVEDVQRETIDPDGAPATLTDGVVLLRRR